MQCDDEIIKGCRKYKRVAQKMLYEKYAPAMRGICARYAHDTQEVSDILQEGFIKVFSNIKQYQGKGSFEGWIKRIIINTAITHFHKSKKHYHHAEISDIKEKRIHNDYVEHTDDNDIEIDKDDIDEKNIDFGLIEKADLSREELLSVLKYVPEDFRVVFNLYAVENYQHKDIATTLGIDVATSRTRLLRAKKIIKKEVYKLSIEKLAK